MRYITGNLFEKIPLDRHILIPHCCNNIKLWGSGFVLAVSNYFPDAKEVYLHNSMELGHVSYYQKDNVIIANMIGQSGVGNNKPIRYAALVQCMEDVKRKIIESQNSEYIIEEIHAPKFGSDRAGGKWELIEELIQEIWRDFPVVVYQL